MRLVLSVLKRWAPRRPTPSSGWRHPRRRLGAELLEDRVVPSGTAPEPDPAPSLPAQEPSASMVSDLVFTGIQTANGSLRGLTVALSNVGNLFVAGDSTLTGILSAPPILIPPIDLPAITFIPISTPMTAPMGVLGGNKPLFPPSGVPEAPESKLVPVATVLQSTMGMLAEGGLTLPSAIQSPAQPSTRDTFRSRSDAQVASQTPGTGTGQSPAMVATPLIQFKMGLDQSILVSRPAKHDVTAAVVGTSPQDVATSSHANAPGAGAAARVGAASDRTDGSTLTIENLPGGGAETSQTNASSSLLAHAVCRDHDARVLQLANTENESLPFIPPEESSPASARPPATVLTDKAFACFGAPLLLVLGSWYLVGGLPRWKEKEDDCSVVAGPE